MLIESYLKHGFQRVKLENVVSSWGPLKKGVPQGSVVGPQCFNVYINDLLLQLDENVIPANYADDNRVSVITNSKEEDLEQISQLVSNLTKWFTDNLMKANVDKFQFMLFCPSTSENKEIVTVNVNGIILKSQNEGKLLGINIEKDLTFNNHIRIVCTKANAKILALRRMLNFLTEDCKLAVLRSFIICHFMYCCILLHFGSKVLRDKMEKILYRGLKLVYKDYESSYEQLLNKAKMDNVELVRQKAIICEMFKCLHETGPEYMNDIFKVSKHISRRGPIFHEPRVHTARYGSHSLRAYGPKLWNNLSTSIKLSKSIDELKRNLKDFKGNPCKCAQCRC